MSAAPLILLVDDDETFVEANRALLESEGYQTVAAYSGAAALEAVEKNTPDLIILDVMMSTDTEGIDVSRRLRERQELKKTPVIMLTGIKKAMNLPFAFEPDKEWLPVQTVLEKPVQPEKLLEAVNSFLRK